ncbi:cellulose-growth-specific protein [Colletotrichum nymphaeae SA-01]|uniref:Cellulose-growth-specific protein n=1 Tax=Colletotrichum nymphaeae SA-01 TaxID=1460502 RepID=A0A135S389_9PEZI|nr:cellulose-growth-specific protein [Colletotrichum nymphaeae SA-01]
MKAFIAILTTFVALSDLVSAHCEKPQEVKTVPSRTDSAPQLDRFTSLVVGGVNTGEYVHVRRNTNYNSPVTDVLSKDIVCNAGGLSSGPATQIATVAAGSTVNLSLPPPPSSHVFTPPLSASLFLTPSPFPCLHARDTLHPKIRESIRLETTH